MSFSYIFPMINESKGHNTKFIYQTLSEIKLENVFLASLLQFCWIIPEKNVLRMPKYIIIGDNYSMHREDRNSHTIFRFIQSRTGRQVSPSFRLSDQLKMETMRSIVPNSSLIYFILIVHHFEPALNTTYYVSPYKCRTHTKVFGCRLVIWFSGEVVNSSKFTRH